MNNDIIHINNNKILIIIILIMKFIFVKAYERGFIFKGLLKLTMINNRRKHLPAYVILKRDRGKGTKLAFISVSNDVN